MNLNNMQTDQNDVVEEPQDDGLQGVLAAEDESVFLPEQASPARTTHLLLIGLLIIGAGAVYFMKVRSGPSAADAAPDAAKATATINEFLTDGGRNMQSMQQALRETEKIVEQFMTHPNVPQVALEELKTNPFRFGPVRSVDEEAEQRRRHEEQRQVVVAAAQRLQLQSIIHSGNRRACMIGNRLYNEQETVDGFLIEQINPGSIVVRKDSFRFELRMRQ